ncbi:hypothetical protein TcWFU_003070 [Taenia crassiceps]|uniref:PDZ domain-containing protein n=1 Tax=Taenia crassiceps TaxID=6207 RepID=A0ABR4QQ59_9CEST
MIVKLNQHAQHLKERNEAAKLDYEHQIESLKNSSNMMSESLIKLQAKYKKWRSRCHVSDVHTHSVGTYCNYPVEGSGACEVAPVVSVASLKLSDEIKSHILEKTLEINEQRAQLGSLELHFREQIQKVEQQLQEVIALKHVQDKEIISLRQKENWRPATRNFRLQWSPPKPHIPTNEVSTQVHLKRDVQCASTMTNFRNSDPSKLDIIITRLENEIFQKNDRIREMEEAYAAALRLIEELKVAIEENKAALAHKCGELEQEKLRLRPRERHDFQSKACQSEPVGYCDRGIYCKPVQTQAAECQVPEVFMDSSMDNVPSFLAEALTVLNEGRYLVSPTIKKGVELTIDTATELRRESHTMPSDTSGLDNGFHLATQTEVNVSVDIVDASHESGTNVQALLEDWNSTENQWISQLRSSSTHSSPTRMPVVRAKQVDSMVGNTEGVPAVAVVTVPVTTVAATVPTSGVVFDTPLWLPNKECDFEPTYRNTTNLDQCEVGVPTSANSTPADFSNVAQTNAQGALEETPPLFGGAMRSSRFAPSSASANEGAWNGSISPSKGRDNFFGLGIWNDDDVEQLAVHFLATEREHSTSLEAAIERHLEGLRLDVISSSLPLVPSADSEEDAKESRQVESEDKIDCNEVVKSSDNADEEIAASDNEAKEKEEGKNEGESDDKELVIEYTVEVNQIEDKPNAKADNSVSSEVEASKNREATPTPESVKVEDHASEPKESPIETPKIPVSRASEALPLPQPPSNSEVVEEVTRSVKEQVAIFSNLNLQKNHGAPKPCAASAFEIDHSNQNDVSNNSKLPTLSIQAPGVTAVYKNVSPKPFVPLETDLTEQTDRQPTEHQPNQPDSTIFERPRPLDRPSEPPPQPKKLIFKAVTSTSPMTFCVPFGGGSQSVKSTESPVKVVSPSQYLGPEVVAQTSRPPMMIRLRRPGPEAPWGFAVFGGADYGCPPFISRVTLHSIAARAGLEVGDIVVSVCDAPVQEKEHSQIKAEILRAGNELDFLVIKQGIDKEILAQRVPHLLRTPAPGVAHTGQPLRTTGTWTSAASPTYTDKATRTRTFRLLDEHLNAMSVQPPPLKPTTSHPARVLSPIQSYHFESAPRSNYTMGRSHRTTKLSNYGRTNQTVYSSIYSPSMSHGLYAQSYQPISVSEMNTNRSPLASPAGLPQGSEGWRNASPTRVSYGSVAPLSCPGTWSSSTNQQKGYHESRSTAERSSIDDPGLMTQYYGTQQTCYAKYQPQSQHHQQRMLHQESGYQSNSEWRGVSPQQSVPTSRLVYRPPGTNFATNREAKDQFRQYQHGQNFILGSNNQGQERWATAGSVQTYNTGWM